MLNLYLMEFILREIARQDGTWMKEHFIVEAVIFDLLRKGVVLMIVEISNVKNNLLSYCKDVIILKIFSTMKDYKIIYMLLIFVILFFVSIYYMDRYLDEIRTTTEMEEK